MSSQPLSRWRIALDLNTMNDLTRGNLAGSIAKMSTTSTLLLIPAIAAGVAAITKKAAALQTGNLAVAADETQLKNDVSQRDSARQSFDLELVSLKGLVLNNATSASDVTGMGYTLLNPQLSSKTVPDAPGQALVVVGKVHGKARATVPTTGYGRFVAESTPNPIGSGAWTSLPGNGKQRKLTGASGTQVWVQFAQVRYGLQSAWSTPVLVTFP